MVQFSGGTSDELQRITPDLYKTTETEKIYNILQDWRKLGATWITQSSDTRSQSAEIVGDMNKIKQALIPKLMQAGNEIIAELKYTTDPSRAKELLSWWEFADKILVEFNNEGLMTKEQYNAICNGTGSKLLEADDFMKANRFNQWQLRNR